MNHFLRIVVISLIALIGNANTRFKVLYSEPLSVFVFVSKIASPQSVNPFKTIYQSSVYPSDTAKTYLQEFENLWLDYSYMYEEYPYGSKINGMTIGLLKKNLIASKDLNEFKLRSVGVIPNATLLKLCEILTFFKPMYEELIYKKYGKEFEKQLLDLQSKMEEVGVERCFTQASYFYKSKWDTTIPFQICVYPLPESQGFSAEAFYNQAICAIPGKINYEVLISVMLHEIFHILYDEQSLETKTQVAAYFNAHPSPCSQYAYLLLNEVLATALGNGYAYKELSGKLDEGEWYDWKYINIMAKQIFPLLEDYIRKNKGLDKDFMDAYVDLYTKNFSSWIKESQHLMSYRSVVTDEEKDLSALSAHYPNCSLFESRVGINATSLEQLAGKPLTKVVIVSKQHTMILASLQRTFPELAGVKWEVSRDFVKRFFLKDKTQLFVINQHSKSIEQLLDLLDRLK